MKKLTTVLLLLCIVFALCSCGNNNTETTDAKAVTYGTIDGQTYKNEYFGINYTFPEDWTISTDEELEELFGIVVDRLGDTLGDDLETGNQVYDLYACDAEQINNVNVVLSYEKSVMKTKTSLTDVELKSLASQLQSAIESVGYENTSCEIGKATLYGKETSVVNLHAEISGIDFYETQAYILKNKYVCVITVANYYENNCIATLEDICK